ncbi:MAG: alpha-glucosidase C-terminal domain-containing protein [Galbitalea sp.]
MVPTNHESVLAFIREYEGSGTQFGDVPERILCVFSFSHNPVSVEIQAGVIAGSPLSDLFGGGTFPRVGEDGSLTLTLGTQDFFWLHIGDAPSSRPGQD